MRLELLRHSNKYKILSYSTFPKYLCLLHRASLKVCIVIRFSTTSGNVSFFFNQFCSPRVTKMFYKRKINTLWGIWLKDVRRFSWGKQAVNHTEDALFMIELKIFTEKKSAFPSVKMRAKRRLPQILPRILGVDLKSFQSCKNLYPMRR